jgi:hypothetical protein
MMGNYEESVRLALKNNMIADAKAQANKQEDEEKKKGLWMMIAMYLLERSEDNIREVV